MIVRKTIVLIFVLHHLNMEAHTAVTCQAPGRFLDKTVTTCRNYTLCVYVKYTNGTETLIPYNYICPGTTVFNPMKGKCTSPANYVCTTAATNSTTAATNSTTGG